MCDLNNCSFTGRLTKDGELSQVGANNTSLLKFAIANNTGFGQYAKTSYFEVSVWGKQADNLAPILKKGMMVSVCGMLEQRKWTSKDGTEHDAWGLSAQQCNVIHEPQPQAHVVEEPPY